MDPVVIQFAAFAALLLLGLSAGTLAERRHLAKLGTRQGELADVGVVNLRTVLHPEQVQQAMLVSGQAVVATDYFKSFVAHLRKIVGGEVRGFERLMYRARQEALLRMLEQARSRGATEVWNVRFETSNIMSATGNRAAVSVEVFAYGTAVIRREA